MIMHRSRAGTSGWPVRACAHFLLLLLFASNEFRLFRFFFFSICFICVYDVYWAALMLLCVTFFVITCLSFLLFICRLVFCLPLFSHVSCIEFHLIYVWDYLAHTNASMIVFCAQRLSSFFLIWYSGFFLSFTFSRCFSFGCFSFVWMCVSSLLKVSTTTKTPKCDGEERHKVQAQFFVIRNENGARRKGFLRFRLDGDSQFEFSDRLTKSRVQPANSNQRKQQRTRATRNLDVISTAVTFRVFFFGHFLSMMLHLFCVILYLFSWKLSMWFKLRWNNSGN